MIVKNKLHPDVLAWEVEMPDLNIDAENLDYELQDGSLFGGLSTRFENKNSILLKKIKNSLNINYIKEKVPNYKEIDIKIFKDIPGFKLFPHLDAPHHKAFLMFNLTNNIDSTTFHNTQKEFLCKGPNKKNMGVFHLLRTKPEILHAIENTSDKNRYTAIAFIK